METSGALDLLLSLQATVPRFNHAGIFALATSLVLPCSIGVQIKWANLAAGQCGRNVSCMVPIVAILRFECSQQSAQRPSGERYTELNFYLVNQSPGCASAASSLSSNSFSAWSIDFCSSWSTFELFLTFSSIRILAASAVAAIF